MSFAAYPMPSVALLGQTVMDLGSSDLEIAPRPSPYEIEDRGFQWHCSPPPPGRIGIKASSSKPNGIHLCQIGCEISLPRIVSPPQPTRARFGGFRAKPFTRDARQSKAVNRSTFIPQKRLARMPVTTLTVDSKYGYGGFWRWWKIR